MCGSTDWRPDRPLFLTAGDLRALQLAKGAVAAGSGTVRINGKAAARTGDALAPHSGTGNITGGSATVRIGG